MSERNRRLLSWSMTAALGLFVVASLLLAPTPTEDRARALGQRIRCPVCQGESIAESPSDSARDMMQLVRDRIAEGRTDQEIIDELVGSYSGSVLLDPPAAGPTLWLWLLPIGAIAIGGWLVASRFRPNETPEQASPTTPPEATRRRVTVGGMVLVIGVAITLAAVGQFRQARQGEPATIDPDSISNETLEAVIAANLDDPQIVGMRLALANRYFVEGDYQKAFPHYQAVVEAEPTPGQASAALTRLGWMVFDGNGDVDLALNLLDQALAAVPADPFALYLKGRVLWCGSGDTEGAVALFTQVLDDAELEGEVRTLVMSDLDAARARSECV